MKNIRISDKNTFLKSKFITLSMVFILILGICGDIGVTPYVSYAATVDPAGYYYKTTEKTHREITITKTATGIDYKLKYTKLSLPYDTINNTSVIIENISGSAISISENKYRHTIGDYSIVFEFSKKNKVRNLKITQNGTLSGQEGNYSFSATYVHFADEQAAGGPSINVKKAKKPGRVTIQRLKGAEEKLYVYFKALKKNCTGYQAQISETKKFKKKTTKVIDGKNNSGTEFTGLKPNKRYYVRIRAYNTNSIGKKTYGKWSKTKSGVAG